MCISVGSFRYNTSHFLENMQTRTLLLTYRKTYPEKHSSNSNLLLFFPCSYSRSLLLCCLKSVLYVAVKCPHSLWTCVFTHSTLNTQVKLHFNRLPHCHTSLTSLSSPLFSLTSPCKSITYQIHQLPPRKLVLPLISPAASNDAFHAGLKLLNHFQFLSLCHLFHANSCLFLAGFGPQCPSFLLGSSLRFQPGSSLHI